jgi:hypothetical protein
VTFRSFGKPPPCYVFRKRVARCGENSSQRPSIAGVKLGGFAPLLPLYSVPKLDCILEDPGLQG